MVIFAQVMIVLRGLWSRLKYKIVPTPNRSVAGRATINTRWLLKKVSTQKNHDVMTVVMDARFLKPDVFFDRHRMLFFARKHPTK